MEKKTISSRNLFVGDTCAAGGEIKTGMARMAPLAGMCGTCGICDILWTCVAPLTFKASVTRIGDTWHRWQTCVALVTGGRQLGMAMWAYGNVGKGASGRQGCHTERQ